MGKPVIKGTSDFTFNVTAEGDSASYKFDGSLDGFEYIFETSSGVFEDGGCAGDERRRQLFSLDRLSLSRTPFPE